MADTQRMDIYQYVTDAIMTELERSSVDPRHGLEVGKTESLADRIRAINPQLRGWASFYRYAFCAKRLFTRVDHYVWWTIFRWLRKKHPNASVGSLFKRYGWKGEHVAVRSETICRGARHRGVSMHERAATTTQGTGAQRSNV